MNLDLNKIMRTTKESLIEDITVAKQNVGGFDESNNIYCKALALLEHPKWSTMLTMAKSVADDLEVKRKSIQVNEGDTLVLSTNEIYLKTLPPGITAEMACAVLQHLDMFRSAVCLAGHHVFADAAVDGLTHPVAELELPMVDGLNLYLRVSSEDCSAYKTDAMTDIVFPDLPNILVYHEFLEATREEIFTQARATYAVEIAEEKSEIENQR